MKIFLNVILVNAALAGAAFATTAATPSFEWNGTSGTVNRVSSGESDSNWRGDIQTSFQNNNCSLNSNFVMQIQDWASNHNFDLSSLNVADGDENAEQSHHDGNSGDDNSGGSDLGSHHDGNSGDGDSGGGDVGSHHGDHQGDQGEGNDDQNEDHTPQAVPEPGTIASLASGALLLSGYLLRRRK